MNGKLEGAGVFTFANGTKYEGSYTNGKKEGTGVHTCANGTKYEGSWRNDLPHGAGRETYAVKGTLPDVLGGHSVDAGDHIDGVFEAGKRHGLCKYTFFNGETAMFTFVEGRCPEFDARQAAVRAAPDASLAQARCEADAAGGCEADANATTEANAISEVQPSAAEAKPPAAYHYLIFGIAFVVAACGIWRLHLRHNHSQS